MDHSSLLSTKVTANKFDEQVYLTVAEDVAERDHAVASLGDVSMDVLCGGVFIGFCAKVRNDPAVGQRFALGLASMADRTVLPE